jgi:hypothetical protein
MISLCACPRVGAKPSDCSRAPSGVSTHANRTRPAPRPGSTFRPLPRPSPKKVRKLWILWKTQDSRRRRLWITLSPRLLALPPSARIGPAPKTREIGHFDLENALSEGRAPPICRTASAASVSFPQRLHAPGASLSLIHNESHPERVRGVRYTRYLAFRLHRRHAHHLHFPQMWKGVWISPGNLR